MSQMPSWKPPQNMAQALDEGDGCWEDERWSPSNLTAMSGTEYEGREIPIAWQLEFDPSVEAFAAANSRLTEMDLEPDGYGWGEYLQNTIGQRDAALANRLHTTDCESDTCVIWLGRIGSGLPNDSRVNVEDPV